MRPRSALASCSSPDPKCFLMLRWICQKANTACIRPVAPTGGPAAISPPAGVPEASHHPRRVDRDRPFLLQLQSVVDLRQEGMTLLDELPAFPVLAKGQILVGLDLRRGVGVVQFDEVEFLDRILYPRHPVGLHLVGDPDL